MGAEVYQAEGQTDRQTDRHDEASTRFIAILQRLLKSCLKNVCVKSRNVYWERQPVYNNDNNFIITVIISWYSPFVPVPTVNPTIQVWSFRLLYFAYYMSCSKNNNSFYFITSCYIKITTTDLLPCIIVSKQHVATVPSLNYKLKHILKNI